MKRANLSCVKLAPNLNRLVWTNTQPNVFTLVMITRALLNCSSSLDRLVKPLRAIYNLASFERPLIYTLKQDYLQTLLSAMRGSKTGMA